MADKFAALSEGILIRDALEPALETGVTLNAAGTTTTSPVVDCLRPMECRVRLATSTVTSTTNSATLNVEIQASNDSTFVTDTVSLGRFAALSGTDAAQSNVVRWLDVYTQKRYLRASVVVGGTAPVYTGTVIRVHPEHYKLTDGDTA